MDEHCHGAKLVCHDVWCTLAAFSQCLDPFYQLLFIANSCDRFTRIQQLVVYHTFLIPPNTQHHLFTINFAFWHWWTWYTWLFLVWDFRSKPIFHRQSQFDVKMTSFRIVQAAIHKSFLAFRVVSRLIYVNRQIAKIPQLRNTKHRKNSYNFSPCTKRNIKSHDSYLGITKYK